MEKNWFKKSYYDKSNWFIENMEKFNLTNEEELLILTIIYCQDSNTPITYDYLCKKLNMKLDHLDKLIQKLDNKGYLNIKIGSKGPKFELNSLYEFDLDLYETVTNDDFNSMINDVFKKPLSALNMEKLIELKNTYGEDKLKDALKKAEMNDKLDVAYVAAICKNNK